MNKRSLRARHRNFVAHDRSLAGRDLASAARSPRHESHPLTDPGRAKLRSFTGRQIRRRQNDGVIAPLQVTDPFPASIVCTYNGVVSNSVTQSGEPSALAGRGWTAVLGGPRGSRLAGRPLQALLNRAPQCRTNPANLPHGNLWWNVRHRGQLSSCHCATPGAIQAVAGVGRAGGPPRRQQRLAHCFTNTRCAL